MFDNKPLEREMSATPLRAFIDSAWIAFETFAADERSKASIHKIFSAVTISGGEQFEPGTRRPVCEDRLETILAGAYHDPKLDKLMASFAAIEKYLNWRQRPVSNSTASENFPAGHANAMVVGPGGILVHKSIMIGASLLAPNVRYPDHDHAPEETYLVMTDGEFRQGDDDWFSPGCGGSFYNPPRIIHAMRSGQTSLFAFWALHV